MAVSVFANAHSNQSHCVDHVWFLTETLCCVMDVYPDALKCMRTDA